MTRSKKITMLAIFAALLFCCIFITVSLADNTPEATMVAVAEGSAPVTTEGTLAEVMSAALKMKPTVPTTYTIDVNKDATLGRYSFASNTNATFIINLNGHTLTDASGAATSNVFQVRKDKGQDGNQNTESVTVNGADANGNRGKLVVKQSTYLVFNNGVTKLALSFKDLDVDFTHKDSSVIATGIVYIYTGSLALDNVHITYRGTADGSNNPDAVMGFVRQPRGATATSYINNCSFIDASASVRTAAISELKANPTLKNCTVVADYGVYNTAETSAYTLTLEGGTVTASTALSALNTHTTVLKGTTVNIESGVLGSGSGAVKLDNNSDGTNTNVINVDASVSALTGNIKYGEGFIPIKTTATSFTLVPVGSDITMLTMPSVFSSKMVIQRDKPIKVWGYVNTDGVTVNVSLDGVSATATVQNGEFSVTLPASPAKRGVSLNISIPDAKYSNVNVTYTDIDLGDVWIMSGQSNIDFGIEDMEDVEEYLANADNYDNIRFFENPSKWEIYENSIGYGTWYDATRKNLEQIGTSAIGYVMATRLAAELGDVTVAIVDSSYAGTMIQSWIDADTYESLIDDTANNYHSLETLNAFRAYYEKNGKMPAAKADLEPYFETENAYSRLSDDEFNKPYRTVASICYNSLVAPLKGIAVKGVVWYQGEGNVIGDRYIPYYEALTASYRSTFGDSTLPFYVIQLAPYVNDNYKTTVSNTKAAQFTMTEADPYSYLISTNLEGATASVQDMTSGKNNSTSLIHPARKSPVGHRLADAILKSTYGLYQNRTVTAPKPIKIELNGSSVVITFDTDLYILYGSSVTGFEISGGSGFVKANAVISGNQVILTADSVTTPTLVRYGYGNLTFELEDGSLITVASCSSAPGSSGSMTVVDTNGVEHTFTAEDGGIVKGFIEGNLTNGSGHPAPTFLLEVGYGVEAA